MKCIVLHLRKKIVWIEYWRIMTLINYYRQVQAMKLTALPKELFWNAAGNIATAEESLQTFNGTPACPNCARASAPPTWSWDHETKITHSMIDIPVMVENNTCRTDSISSIYHHETGSCHCGKQFPTLSYIKDHFQEALDYKKYELPDKLVHYDDEVVRFFAKWPSWGEIQMEPLVFDSCT